jgi:hypothetical protein
MYSEVKSIVQSRSKKARTLRPHDPIVLHLWHIICTRKERRDRHRSVTDAVTVRLEISVKMIERSQLEDRLLDLLLER